MRTPICEQLDIEFPIFAFTHCRDVVAAVSNAGGLGVLGAVGFSAEQLEIELKWIDEHVGDKPYGVDIVIGNETYKQVPELATLELRVPVSNQRARDASRAAVSRDRLKRRVRMPSSSRIARLLGGT